jgi:hypothetical protein
MTTTGTTRFVGAGAQRPQHRQAECLGGRRMDYLIELDRRYGFKLTS